MKYVQGKEMMNILLGEVLIILCTASLQGMEDNGSPIPPISYGPNHV